MPPSMEEKHLKSSEMITDIVIGMSDGLTVPFALAAGLSSAVSDNSIITTAGIAEIVAGSIAMGLGGYLAGKTEQDHYEAELAREYHEVEVVPEKEKEEIRDIFREYGLSDESQVMIVEELSKDKDKWVEFMMKYELGLEKPDPKRAPKSAATIGISYAIGGLVPLIPYFIVQSPINALIISCIVTGICLLIFGFFKSRVTGQPPVTGALKVLLIGGLAAAAAFAVAKLIESRH